jgi:hypothetical protein
MALVGGPESYGMRIQLKFKESYWLSLNPILDLQVGKASGSDALIPMSLERLILEEVLR